MSDKHDNKQLKSFLPWIAALVASIGYFVLAINWLISKELGPVVAVVASGSVFLFLSVIVFIIETSLRRHYEKEEKRRKAEKIKKGDSDNGSLRRARWLEGLMRDSAATHDRVLNLGAIIGVGLVLFAWLMGVIFKLPPQQVYFIPWWGLALLWFLQIALLPRWATYTSFLTMAGLRVGIEFFGLGILSMLPNFIMLPVFYLLMMFFMYGSIMLPSLWQTKYHRPGEGDWEVRPGAMQGQPQARAIFETLMQRIEDYRGGKTSIRPPRGVISSGPPGTGKTMLVKEYGSTSRYPVVISDGSAFNPPFVGFAPLLVGYHRIKSEALAREYGWLFFVIDECETLLGMRGGMMPGITPSAMSFWDVTIPENDCQIEGTPWHLRPEHRNKPIEHNMIMPMGGGMGGAGIYPFLTWMSGAESPPFFTVLWRGTVNTLLNALFVPVSLFGKVLRLPPAKIQPSNITFVGLTNRRWMIDPAMMRPGRLELEANFVNPDDLGRYDTLEWYIKLLHEAGQMRDEVLDPDKIWSLARSTPGRSQAELEKLVREAVSVRQQHLANLRRILKIANEGGFNPKVMATLPENQKRQREMDRRYWNNHAHEVRDAQGNDIPEGWDERVDFDALLESMSRVSWGAIQAEMVHPETQRGVAFHEVGHFFDLIALMVRGFGSVPTVLTSLPRGEGSLGKIIYLPKDPREQYPQSFYEGMLRVALGAYVAEIVMFGQNTPGVSGDLRHATGLSALMRGKFGMRVASCPNEEERRRYIAIGENAISLPESGSFLNPEANTLVQQALTGRDRESVALMLGMAAVDCYRLLMANLGVYAELVAEVITNDEISGDRLREVQAELLNKMVFLDQLSEEQRSAFPKDDFAFKNPFYGPPQPEGAEVVRKVDRLVAARKGDQS